MKSRKPLTPKVGGFLAAVFFATNSLFAYTPEGNLWSDRQKAARSRRSDMLLAAVPSASNTLPVNSGQPISSALTSDVRKSLPPDFAGKHKKLFEALSPVYGTIRRVSFPDGKSKQGPLIIHIQDVHQNLDAQRNIGKLIQSLIDAQQIDRVALEGAPMGSLVLGPYREFFNQHAVRAVADYLVQNKQITGPLYTALTSTVPFWDYVGIEDPYHYTANVKAYQESVASVSARKEELGQKIRLHSAKKLSVYSAPLLVLDRAVEAYDRNSLPLGDFVSALRAAVNEKALPKSVQQFSRALAMEKTIAFDVVDRQRIELVGQLTTKLNKPAMDSLFAQSMAYRSGTVTYGLFYRFIKNLCEANGVSLKKYPAMEEYINYVLLSDGINAEALFQDLAKLEAQAYSQLAQTETEKALVAQGQELRLSRKLIEFSLTPGEWAEYKSQHMSSPALSSFERFYEEAHIRDQKMAENLLAQIKNTDKAIILVTGGYHSPGLKRELVNKGATVVSVVPKVEKIDNAQGSSYLTVFAQEKTPLEKLFQKERIFLGEDVAAQLRERVTPLVPPTAALDHGDVQIPSDEITKINSFLTKVAGTPIEFDVDSNKILTDKNGRISGTFTYRAKQSGTDKKTSVSITIMRDNAGNIRLATADGGKPQDPFKGATWLLNKIARLHDWLGPLAIKVSPVTEYIFLRTFTRGPIEFYLWFIEGWHSGQIILLLSYMGNTSL